MTMQAGISLLQIAFAYILMLALGLGLALLGLPRSVREHALYAAPAIGYASFCFLAIWFSSITGAAMGVAAWVALAALLVTSAATCFNRRADLARALGSWKPIAGLFALMTVLVFTPVLWQGADLYLGTVNPDFLQSLAFQEQLVRGHLPFWTRTSADASLFTELLFPEQFQARFGAVAFSTLLQEATGMTARTSLAASLAAFVLCLPPAVFFFARAVLEFDRRAALLAAAFAAISASITMSFVHALVGQNSALAMFPLAIALVYTASRERRVAPWILVAMLLNAVFWLYVMALPYILAPFGLYFLLKLRSGGLRATSGMWLGALAVVVFTAAAHAGFASLSGRFVADLAGLLKGISLSGFYRDFLTEDVFIYGTGLSSYALVHNAFLLPWVEYLWPVLTILAFALAIVYFVALHRWEKTVSRDASFVLFSLLATYLAVWFYYTFVTRYGYASFKMVAWLQFVAVPMYAWILTRSVEDLRRRDAPRRARAFASAIVALMAVYVGGNVLSVIDYGEKSFGRDLVHGSLINSYGISGNPDFPDLPASLRPILPAGSRLALGFNDYIENLVAAYHTSGLGLRTSLLSHDRLPDDDSFLPDIHTRRTLDTAGRTTIYEPKHFMDGEADYYLLPGPANPNADIVANDQPRPPAWFDRSFRLYRRADLRDLAFTGRGFFRIEHFERGQAAWWWPRTFRWTAEGGEIYHLLASAPGAEYRVAFTAIAGLGRASGTRTVEVWHNGERIDEIGIDGAARVVSKPYRAVAGVNLLVLKVREKAAPNLNRTGYWNRDLSRNVRQLNLVVSDVVVARDPRIARPTWPTGRALVPAEYLDAFDTFDGFDVDGWIRDRAGFSIRADEHAKFLALQILVPGNLGFTFPYHVRLSLNGAATEREFAAPGTYELRLPIASPGGTLDALVVPQEARRIADGMERREVLQSVRLGRIAITHD